MTILYNLRYDGESYRITKFHDDEVEGSYLVTYDNCDCPAGHRHTCRHRQMLPDLLPIIDTHWFWNFDTHTVVDLMGTPKATLDALIAPIVERTVVQDTSTSPPTPWRRL